MENKNYAYLIRVIFGEKSENLDENAINSDPAVEAAVDELTAELYEPLSMEYYAVNDIVLEGKNTEDFAEFIRANADELAKQYMSKAIRPLRHPENSGKLKEFIKYTDK